jgi:hypothetical protein
MLISEFVLHEKQHFSYNQLVGFVSSTATEVYMG